MIKKEKDFLPHIFFSKLKNIVSGNIFQWYFQYGTNLPTKESVDNFMFTHTLYFKESNSEWFPIFEPILYFMDEKYKVEQLLRMKLNLYVNQHKKLKHDPHLDFPDMLDQNVKIGLLNFTTCNGGTNINKETYDSKENELIVFDNKLEHYGITQTNKPTRIVLNIGWK